jgi:hypothetical protein
VIKLESNISKLEYELSWLRKKLFGKMSERFINSDPDSRQLDIFGEQLGENKREELEKAAKLEQELITKTITVTKTRTPRKDVSFENLQSFPTAPSTNAWQIRVFSLVLPELRVAQTTLRSSPTTGLVYRLHPE